MRIADVQADDLTSALLEEGGAVMRIARVTLPKRHHLFILIPGLFICYTLLKYV